MSDNSSDSDAPPPGKHEIEMVVDLDKLEVPIEFAVKSGKNQIVIRLRRPGYKFSV